MSSYIRTKKHRRLQSEIKRKIFHAPRLGNKSYKKTRDKIRLSQLGKKEPPRTLLYRKNLSLRTSGKGNPNWKGGVTPILRRIRTSEKYYIWRLEVLKRDNFTCQYGVTLCKKCHSRMHPNKIH